MSQIQQTDHTKFLGLIIDQNLNFKYHINYISSKISKSVGILFKLKYFLPNDVLKLIYLSFIHPYLNYGIEAWFAASKNLTDRIFIFQKKAIRAIFDLPYNAHTSNFFKTLRILKLHDIYNLQVGKIMYSAIKKGTYSKIAEALSFKSLVHQHRTRQIEQLNIPRYTRTKSQRSLLFTGTKLWNQISSIVDCEVSFSAFKLHLKEHYLDIY